MNSNLPADKWYEVAKVGVKTNLLSKAVQAASPSGDSNLKWATFASPTPSKEQKAHSPTNPEPQELSEIDNIVIYGIDRVNYFLGQDFSWKSANRHMELLMDNRQSSLLDACKAYATVFKTLNVDSIIAAIKEADRYSKNIADKVDLKPDDIREIRKFAEGKDGRIEDWIERACNTVQCTAKEVYNTQTSTAYRFKAFLILACISTDLSKSLHIALDLANVDTAQKSFMQRRVFNVYESFVASLFGSVVPKSDQAEIYPLARAAKVPSEMELQSVASISTSLRLKTEMISNCCQLITHKIEAAERTKNLLDATAQLPKSMSAALSSKSRKPPILTDAVVFILDSVPTTESHLVYAPCPSDARAVIGVISANTQGNLPFSMPYFEGMEFKNCAWTFIQSTGRMQTSGKAPHIVKDFKGTEGAVMRTFQDVAEAKIIQAINTIPSLILNQKLPEESLIIVNKTEIIVGAPATYKPPPYSGLTAITEQEGQDLMKKYHLDTSKRKAALTFWKSNKLFIGADSDQDISALEILLHDIPVINFKIFGNWMRSLNCKYITAAGPKYFDVIETQVHEQTRRISARDWQGISDKSQAIEYLIEDLKVLDVEPINLVKLILSQKADMKPKFCGNSLLEIWSNY